MRFTKEEKELLFVLLDDMTDRCPQVLIDVFLNDHSNHIFWTMFKKLRFELKGY